MKLITSVIALTALAAGESALAQRIQAESIFFDSGTIVEEPGQGVFVRCSGATQFAFEASFGGNGSELDIRSRATDGEFEVHVTIDPEGTASSVIDHRESNDGSWRVTTVLIPLQPDGPRIVTVDIIGDVEIDVDWFTTCQTDDKVGGCDGCSFGPWTGTIVRRGVKKQLKLPSVGKFSEVPGVSEYTDFLTSIGIVATSLDDAFGDAVINGACSWQREDGAAECAPKKCLPLRGCSFRSRVKFTPNDYARMPFTDEFEEIVFPSGKKRSYRRGYGPFQAWERAEAGCDESKFVEWQFENEATVIQVVNCRQCPGQAGSSNN